MIRGIALDLEGTLVDVEHVHHEGHLAAAREVGLDVTIEEAVDRFPHFIGGPDQEIAREIWEAAERASTVEAILRTTKAYYAEHISRTSVCLRAGVREFLSAAEERGLRFAIGSNTPRAQAAHLLRTSGLDRVVPPERAVFAEDVRRPKPSPDVYVETAVRMGVLAREQVVFDDSVNGIRAGIAAGSVAVGAPIFPQTADVLLEAGAAFVFLDWRDAQARFECLEHRTRWEGAIQHGIAQVPDELLCAAAGAILDAHLVVTAGNGGSSALASHAAQAIVKPDYNPGGGRAAVCLTDSAPAYTAHANDGGWVSALVEAARPFFERVERCAVFALSSSGRSENVVRLAQFAVDRKSPVIALTGFDGEPLRSLATVSIHVGSRDYEVIEPVHDALLHRIQYHLRQIAQSRS